MMLKTAYHVLYKVSPKKFRRFLKKIRIGYSLVFNKNSYLVKTGFIESHLNDNFKDSKGEYVPWMNYPFIDFLKERLNETHQVFEFGSGFSSIFFSKRVQNITSVEYDKEWFNQINKIIHGNGKVHFVPLDEDYALSISKIEEGKKYNIVIVDGRMRVKCAKEALKHLAQDGVLIFDDSYRQHYKEGLSFYLDKGFKSIVFRGIKPVGLGMEETTLFYKENNCLGI